MLPWRTWICLSMYSRCRLQEWRIKNSEKDLQIKEGDELIILGHGNAFEELAETFLENRD